MHFELPVSRCTYKFIYKYIRMSLNDSFRERLYVHLSCIHRENQRCGRAFGGNWEKYA